MRFHLAQDLDRARAHPFVPFVDGLERGKGETDVIQKAAGCGGRLRAMKCQVILPAVGQVDVVRVRFPLDLHLEYFSIELLGKLGVLDTEGGVAQSERFHDLFITFGWRY